MKEKLLLLFISTFLSLNAAFAQRAVSGTVTAQEDGLPLIGVAVAAKGASPLAVTDLDGKYTVQVPENTVLVFTYLGMENAEVKVTGATHNVVMKSLSNQITELVVTAQGVSQEKKKLNFAVQTLDSEELLAGKSTNFVDALQGKISGVSISSGGGSPNSASQMIIRSISSINPSANNEPLFVIDGMQVSGGASAAASINPNDIENVTVLKGAAASALYGQEAANGAVMITTKSGSKGKMTVNASASFQVENATRIPKIQSKYAPGVFGVNKDQLMGGWGAELAPGAPRYNNAKNYFDTGILHKYDVSASGGTDKFTAYASVSYSSQTGIVPNDYVNRVGALLKASFDPTSTINLSFMANIINSESRDAVSKSYSELSSQAWPLGPLGNVYNWPINDDMSNYKYADGSIRWLYDANSWSDNPINPNWRRYEDYKRSESTRNIMQMSGTWKPVKGLNLTGRLGYDQSNSVTDQYTTPRFVRANLPDTQTMEAQYFGTYDINTGRSSIFTAQALATYNIKLTEDLGVEALLGSETKLIKGFSTEMGGTEFIDPTFYSFNNLKNTFIKRGLSANHKKQKRYAHFGELRFDYKSVLQISGTLRNDHTSTLQPGNRSYFYPSVTAGLIFSELLGLRSDFFDYGKIRGNWAKVGKDTAPYLFGQKYVQRPTLPDGGMSVNTTLSRADDDLKPEMSKSWEIGADLRFFGGKTRLDIAYYSVAVDDQIVTVRVSPAVGTILQTRNQGDIENKGMEISLDQEIMKQKDFKWNAVANFSYNRGKVKSLPDQLKELTSVQVQDAYGSAYVNESTTSITGKDYLRTPDGQIVVNEDGFPQIDPAKSILIGNREPDFIAGLANNIKYKEFGLSFLFDFRSGGDVYNGTSRSLYSNGQHKKLETYRNREIIFDGVVKQADGTYAPNTKAVLFDQTFMNNYFNPVTSNFIEDGSFIRLTYVTLSYDLSKFVKKSPLKALNLSVTGRNLLLITRYSGSDPIVNQGSTGGAGSSGFDFMNVPSTRSFNVSLNATF